MQGVIIAMVSSKAIQELELEFMLLKLFFRNSAKITICSPMKLPTIILQRQ